MKRILAAFALGAVLGTGLDAIHVYGDVETYSSEVFGELGWFVPLEFGLAGVAAALAIPILERRFGPGHQPVWTAWERLREVILLTGLYVTSIAVNGPNAALFLIALVVLLAVRLRFVSTRGDLGFALTAAVAGPVVEAAIHAVGAFDYTEPDVLGLPLWLPGLWANGGLAIRRLFGPLAVPEPHEAAERANVG
jgi:uncharacterized protein DUF2878